MTETTEMIVCKSEKFVCVLVIQKGTTTPVLMTSEYARAIAAELNKYADEIEKEAS